MTKKNDYFVSIQVKNEIEHLLDDDNDMAQFYLTRKHHLNQQNETMAPTGTSNSILLIVCSDIHQSESIIGNKSNSDVEDLEMLLEAFFVSLDGTRNKILRVGIFPSFGDLIFIVIIQCLKFCN